MMTITENVRFFLADRFDECYKPHEIASMLRFTPKQVRDALRRLLAKGVVGRSDEGNYFIAVEPGPPSEPLPEHPTEVHRPEEAVDRRIPGVGACEYGSFEELRDSMPASDFEGIGGLPAVGTVLKLGALFMVIGSGVAYCI